MSPQLSRSLYFKNLDASRFLAFVLVFFAHCFVTTDPEIKANPIFSSIYQWGKVGVLGLDYFFVLSSFLISMIILREKKQTGSFHLSNFLIRRSLRVWPLYFLILSLGFIIVSFPSFFGPVKPLPDWPYLIFFWVNFYIINHGTEFLFFIAFLWSISIEEQFYLIWSLFLKFVRLSFPLFCLILICISLLFRFYYLNEDGQLYFHTLSTLGNFGVGGLLAYGLFTQNPTLLKLSFLKKAVAAGIYLILLLSIGFYHQLIDVPWFKIFSRLYYSILFAWFILDQSNNLNPWFNAGKIKLFNYLGKISYGLYCYHGVVITLLVIALRHFSPSQNLALVLIVFPMIILTSTLLLSHLSYRYFEKFFLQLKDKFYTFKP